MWANVYQNAKSLLSVLHEWRTGIWRAKPSNIVPCMSLDGITKHCTEMRHWWCVTGLSSTWDRTSLSRACLSWPATHRPILAFQRVSIQPPAVILLLDCVDAQVEHIPISPLSLQRGEKQCLQQFMSCHLACLGHWFPTLQQPTQGQETIDKLVDSTTLPCVKLCWERNYALHS